MPYTANPVWSFPVNWDQGVLERLEWKTDVMSSELGAEQRVPRRLYPRRTFEAGYLLNKEDRQRFNVFASTYTARDLVFPIWHDLCFTTALAASGTDILSLDTRFREFAVGDLVFIRGANSRSFEVGIVEAKTLTTLQLISNLEKTWPVGTKVYPAKLGRVDSDFSPTKLSDELFQLQASIRLVTPSPVPVGMAPAYKSSPVINLRPEDSEDQQFEYARSMAMLDNAFGRADYYDILGGPILRQTHKWTLVGASQHYEFRKFLYSMKGRAKALWLPTFMSDMTPVADLASGNAYIDIVNIGASADGTIFPGRSDLRIEFKDGTVLYREIIDIVALSESVERVALDATIGSDVAADQVLSISYMMVARLDQDSVELNHTTDVVGVTTCSINFYGPTQATPLVIPVFTSRPYPIDILDSLDAAVSYRSTIMWTFDQPYLDVSASFVGVSMPVVVSYETYGFMEALDVTPSHVSTSMPVVVSYRTYDIGVESLNVNMAFISVSMPVVVHYVTYDPDPESLDVAASFVSTTMSP